MPEKPPARGGRPRLAAGRSRSRRVGFAITPDELAALQRRARPGRVGPTVRRVALEWAAASDRPAPAEPVDEPDALARAVAGLYADLGRVGGNLNQIAKALNRSGIRKLLRGRRAADEEIATALRETRAVLDRIPPLLVDVMEARR